MHRRTLGSLSAPSTQGRYAQAVSIQNATEWVHISGQVGATVDGVVPLTFEEQCRLAWRNLGAQLAEAGMSFTDLVKVTAIVTDRANIEAYRAIRKDVLETTRSP